MKTYYTEGVCSTEINIVTEDGILTYVKFEGGCDGNLKAIGALVKGMRISWPERWNSNGSAKIK